MIPRISAKGRRELRTTSAIFRIGITGAGVVRCWFLGIFIAASMRSAISMANHCDEQPNHAVDLTSIMLAEDELIAVFAAAILWFVLRRSLEQQLWRSYPSIRCKGDRIRARA